MEYVTLNNGVKIPQLGFGVYQVPKEECERCVLDAIKAGYRHIDTAQSYFNEAEVGDAVSKCGVPREDLFITSKVWIDNYGYEKTRKSVLAGIEKLKSGYIDLMLLHQPFADYYGAYRALEDLYKEGKIRAIGVSNFAPDRLADIAQFNEIKPAVDQVEINVFNQQKTALDNMENAAFTPRRGRLSARAKTECSPTRRLRQSPPPTKRAWRRSFCAGLSKGA